MKLLRGAAGTSVRRTASVYRQEGLDAAVRRLGVILRLDRSIHGV